MMCTPMLAGSSAGEGRGGGNNSSNFGTIPEDPPTNSHWKGENGVNGLV